MKRGEIWTVAGGKDYAGTPRPAVVVQDDAFDDIESITICTFATDHTEAPSLRLPVEPTQRTGLRADCQSMMSKIVGADPIFTRRGCGLAVQATGHVRPDWPVTFAGMRTLGMLPAVRSQVCADFALEVMVLVPVHRLRALRRPITRLARSGSAICPGSTFMKSGLASKGANAVATACRSSAGAAAISSSSSSRPSTMFSTSSRSWLLKKSPPPRLAKACSFVATKATALTSLTVTPSPRSTSMAVSTAYGYQRLENPSTSGCTGIRSKTTPEAVCIHRQITSLLMSRAKPRSATCSSMR
ncbi:MAG: type II toxin-antitoxin system PemK/MazF family toxin [Burkholderiales bacterium]|nr:type II toxin-antitoxin system PemK/MazF family toxin [Burkholderiales bacterium]